MGDVYAGPSRDTVSRAADLMDAYPGQITPNFANSLVEMSDELEIDPMWLANQMDAETGGTFSTTQKNRAGSGAVGLIQFMPSTAARLAGESGFVDFQPKVDSRGREYHTSDQKRDATKFFSEMDEDMQLHMVWRYLSPYRGKMKSPGDLGLAVFFPRALGEGRDFDIEDWYRKNRPKRLEAFMRQNKGIRTAGDYLDLVESRARHTRRRIERTLEEGTRTEGLWPLTHTPESRTKYVYPEHRIQMQLEPKPRPKPEPKSGSGSSENAVTIEGITYIFSDTGEITLQGE